MTEEQYLANQNLQAQLRQYLSSFINNISVSNIDSILQQSAMLNELTSSTDSITRTMAVKLFPIIKITNKKGLIQYKLKGFGDKPMY